MFPLCISPDAIPSPDWSARARGDRAIPNFGGAFLGFYERSPRCEEGEIFLNVNVNEEGREGALTIVQAITSVNECYECYPQLFLEFKRNGRKEGQMMPPSLPNAFFNITSARTFMFFIPRLFSLNVISAS